MYVRTFIWILQVTTAILITILKVAVSEGCAGYHTTNNNEIFSPRHPAPYPNNMDCTWRIKAPEGHLIQLTFSSFHLEPERDCQFDYVSVLGMDGSTIGKFCGKVKPFAIMSLNSIVIVKFYTDNRNAKEGFKARYEFVPKQNESCGGNLTESKGEIISPLYPHQYPPNVDCTWMIRAPVKYLIRLTFSNFSLLDSENCRNDYVSVEEMKGSSIRKFCGHEVRPQVFTSNNSALVVKFHSDRLYDGGGFRAQYQFLPNPRSCGLSHRTQNNSHISSPMYPEKYPSNTNCSYNIQAPVGHIIRLTFSNFSLQYSDRCKRDYVLVEDTGSGAVGKFCGTRLPPVITSKNNTLMVNFHSDSEVDAASTEYQFRSLYQFRAKYQFLPNPRICGGHTTEHNGEISSPLYPHPYPHNVDCTWRIEVKDGYRILLTFSSFNLEDDSETCRFDYVLVQETEGDTIRRFCGTVKPPVITSMKNTLIVKFHSDHSDAGDGFKASYESILE